MRSAPPPQLPLTIRQGVAAPLQAQIAEQIRKLVSEGILRPSMRVPSTRALSDQLGVSRNTVAIAYELLIAEGFLEVESSVGTVISTRLPEPFMRARALGAVKAVSSAAPQLRTLLFPSVQPSLPGAKHDAAVVYILTLRAAARSRRSAALPICPEGRSPGVLGLPVPRRGAHPRGRVPTCRGGSGTRSHRSARMSFV